MLPPTAFSFSIHGNSVLPLLRSETLESFSSPSPLTPSNPPANSVGFMKYVQNLTTAPHFARCPPGLRCHIFSPWSCSSFLDGPLLLLSPCPVLCLQPSSQMELIKNKSKHVPPLFKTLQRLPMSLGVKAKVLTMALLGNIWPPAAFLIPSPCFPPCSPCSSHLISLLSEAPCAAPQIWQACCCLKPLHCLFPPPGNALPPKSHMACFLTPSSLCSNVTFSRRFSHFLNCNTPSPLPSVPRFYISPSYNWHSL